MVLTRKGLMLINMRSILIGVLGCLLLLFATKVTTASAAPFYEGKTLVMVQGDAPGGTGDLRTRAVTHYLQKHLPGKPTIVQQYIPGGGGVLAANHLANVAKRDGLTLGYVHSSVYSHAILGAPGVRYDLKDFILFGGPTPGGPYTLVLRPGLGIDTVEKLKAHKGIRFAQRSVGHSMYNIDRVMAFVLELKNPKWILGYSSPEIDPALERKEADARSNSIPSFMRRTRHLLNEGFTVPIVMKNIKGRGAEVVPGFPQGLPALEQFANTNLKREILHFHRNVRPPGGVVALKGIPRAAEEALQRAFDQLWKDPDFAKHYKKLTGADADPASGAEIQKALRSVPKNPEIMKVYKQLIGGGPLPSPR